MPIRPERSTIQGFSIIALTTALLLLAGCQFNPLKPKSDDAPATSTALESACATDCDMARTQCEERQRLREQLCQEQTTRLQNDTTPCNTTTNPLCPKPTACLGEDMGLCGVQHAECLTRCADTPAPAPTPAKDRAES
ncbi:hypothetical protein [Allochromatium vinosum]|uniref:Lipoprotein n=1 Tax=Allochromatium vinosum (strain ATCC 17899 / DSM 180 / NBRC 103801 / NCIMB 10441 / D) TaxID=572477 RepID=D3RSL7_ALLVD|nr:hypothetical protein [Allochromatium vinosum]ADC62176.1 hypothetical protein Alvin_1237 [Allochromatium vinosum DSM 180]MBK1653604.1 hypothetical protein [Allochromatium vinosum]